MQVNAMLAQLDKAKARRQELEQKLRDAEKAYKREVRHREDLAYQVKVGYSGTFSPRAQRFLFRFGVEGRSFVEIWYPPTRLVHVRLCAGY